MGEFDIAGFSYAPGEAPEGPITSLTLTYSNASSLRVFFTGNQLSDFVALLTNAIEHATQSDTTGAVTRWPLQAVRKPKTSAEPAEMKLGLRVRDMHAEIYNGCLLVIFVHTDGEDSIALITPDGAQQMVNHARNHQAFSA